MDQEKINCGCGSIVMKKNLSSHVKTKKHMVSTGGPPSLHRSSSVSFADAQKTDRADEEEEDFEDEDDEILEEIVCMIEELGKAHQVLDQKLDSIISSLSNLLTAVQSK